MTYEQAVAWLEEILDRPLMLGFKINVRAVLAVLEREHENAERLRSARKIVDQQAEDEGLWFVAEFATEAYLQTALRELHEAVETGAARKGVER